MSARASVPVGRSPPTSGSSKWSSSSRSAAATSRSRISPSSGPSGVSIAPASPAMTASASPISMSRRRRCSASALGEFGLEVVGCEVGRLQHAVEEVADVGAAGHRGERRPGCPQLLLLRVGERSRVVRRGRGCRLVVDELEFGFGRHRLLVRRRRRCCCRRSVASGRRVCDRSAPLGDRAWGGARRPSGRRSAPRPARPRSCPAPPRRALRGVRRPRRPRVRRSPLRRRRLRRLARRGAGRATSSGIRMSLPTRRSPGASCG